METYLYYCVMKFEYKLYVHIYPYINNKSYLHK